LSDYELLTSGLNPYTTSYYYDYSVSGISNKFLDWQYVVIISGLTTGLTSQTTPVTITPTRLNAAKEIVRRRAIVLNRKSASKFQILKKRRYGTFCTECGDPILQKTTKSRCGTCYGTGYVGGYYSAITVSGQLNEAPTRQQLVVFGGWHDQDSILYTNTPPILDPDDFVMDVYGRRWVVQSTRTVNMAIFIIAQIVQMRLAEKESDVYLFPLTL
jgi:hypothetical protein